MNGEIMVGAIVAALALVVVLVAQLLGRRGRALAFRWFAGQALTGKPWRTDATWLRPGTKNLHHAPVRRWSYWPGWRRSAARQAGTLVLAVIVWGLVVHPTATLVAIGLTVALGVAGVIRANVRSWRLRDHRQEVITPLHAVLSEVLSLSPATRPESYLHVPLDYARDDADGHPVVVDLPLTHVLTSKAKTTLEEVTLPRLGLSASTADVSWSSKGAPRMTIRMAPQPPDKVFMKDMLGEIAKNKPGELILGLDARRGVRRGDFNSDDPHWGFSCGSRRGKSTFLQMTAMQLKVQDPLGMKGTFIDVKMTSFPAMVGIPGFTIYNDPRNLEAMWGGINAVRAEMEERMDATDQDPTLEWPGLFLFMDEVNQFAQMTKSLWRKIKEKGDPNIAPVWEDVAAIVWQGAQFNVHLIVTGQRLDDQAFGGNGLRDSLGFRGLAGYRPQQWAMLIGTSPIPRSRKERGRWVYSDGEDIFWVQNMFGTNDEIRDYILAAVRKVAPQRATEVTGADQAPPVTVTVTSAGQADVPLEQGGQFVTGASVTGSVTPPWGSAGSPAGLGAAGPSGGAQGPQGGRERPAWLDITPLPKPARLFTLAEAAREEIVPLSAEALRQAKRRDGDDFPAGTMVGKREKWTAAQLQEWMQDRLEKAITEPGEDGRDRGEGNE